MWYQFMTTVYSKCGFAMNTFMDSEEFGVEAKNLIQKINAGTILKKTGLKPISNRSYGKLLNNLKKIKKSCIDENGKFKARDDKDVKKHFQAEILTPVDKRYCLFTYFLITETKLFQDNLGKCVSYEQLYKDLMTCGGHMYDQEVYPYMEDYIRAYILKSNQGLDIYQGLLDSWDEHCNLMKEDEDSDSDLILPYITEKRILTYEQWQEIIDAGLEQVDNEKRTRRSMSLIQGQLTEVVRDESKKGQTDISVVFPKEIIHSVKNTEKRRTWYMFRMLSNIIEHQIEDILDTIEDYREGQPDAKQGVKKAIEACWLEKGKEEGVSSVYATLSQIGQNPSLLNQVSIDEIRRALYSARINVAKLGADFDYYFDGVYVDFDDEETERRKLRSKGYAFAGYTMRYGLYSDANEEVTIQERTAERGIKMILSGEGKVSREMLMLTALVALALGVKIGKEYVKDHILFNCRFSREYNPYSVFDNYFLEVFDQLYEKVDSDDNSDSIEILKKKSGLLEAEYIYEPMYTIDSLEEKKNDEKGIAIFHDILFGKKVV